MTESTLPKRILTLGDPKDYPPEFGEISAACDFAIAAAPDGKVAVVKDRQGIVPRQPTLHELTSVQVVTPADVPGILGRPISQDGSADYAHEAPAPDGWQGTEPVEDTRRRIILDAIKSSPDGQPMTPLELADRIESALLDSTIADEAEEDYEEWDVAMGPDGKAYIGIECLTDFLFDLGEEAREAVEDEGERPVAAIGGRRGGKRQAMIDALREDAATEADAEAAVEELERTGRAFLDSNGRHIAPGEVTEVRKPLGSLLDLFSSFRR